MSVVETNTKAQKHLKLALIYMRVYGSEPSDSPCWQPEGNAALTVDVVLQDADALLEQRHHPRQVGGL